MDRRDFLKSALVTAGTAQSAIVLGGMRPLEQFAGPQDAIVVPGVQFIRIWEAQTIVIADTYGRFIVPNSKITMASMYYMHGHPGFVPRVAAAPSDTVLDWMPGGRIDLRIERDPATTPPAQ